MKELSSSLTYPMESDDWVVTVLIGGVLVFLGFLLVPLALVYGYLVGAIRDSLTGEPAPSTFDDWGAMLVDGVQAMVVWFVYLLVPLVVGAVAVGGAVLAMATGTETGAAAGLGGLFVGFALTALLLLVFGYVATAAVVNFAREARFGAAFDVGVLKRVVLSRDFAIAWLVSFVVLLVVGLIGSLPLVGWILAPFAGFYGMVVAAGLWADGFSAALAGSRSTAVEPTAASR